MKQIPTIFYMVFLLSFTLFSQQTVVKGSVKDLISNQALAQVAVTFEGTLISTQTNALGEFIFPCIYFDRFLLGIIILLQTLELSL